MIDLLKQIEETPDAYPDAPSGLSTGAAALDAAMIWARIESYTAYRFTVREVIWIIEGSTGAVWSAPLTPVVSQVAEFWIDDGWEPITLLNAPVGICLQGAGFYRITAQVGAGDVPAPVNEAFRRLAEYLADDPGTAGASSTSVSIGPIEESLNRNPAWVAKAMQYSGAGDLLRNFRRA